MSNLIMAAEWDVILEYIIYAVIIVVCVALLILIRKHNRLPRHPEFKKRIEGLLERIDALSGEGGCEKKYDFIKQLTRALYVADKLNYTATVMAEKERDGDIGRVATALDAARNELVQYKYGRRDRTDGEGIAAAAEKVRAAVDIMDRVIERDSAIKARKAKK